MDSTFNQVSAKVVAPLQPSFSPLVLANRAYCESVAKSGNSVPLVIGTERASGAISRYETVVFAPGTPGSEQNIRYIERLVKTLLWTRGGWKVFIGGPKEIGEAIQAIYSSTGERAFDAEIMQRIYDLPLTIVPCAVEDVPAAVEPSVAIGGHLDGCRIGFDAGASDRKVAAVIDGEAVYSEEVVWDPRPQTNAKYHYDEIMTAMRTAASHMPRVDAIGVSSAGIFVDNRIKSASLFRGIPLSEWNSTVRDLFLDIKREWNVPLEVMNDGDVTALAGAMSLNDTAVIGVALGSSEAAGFVTPDGTLTTWMNELAFVPIDADPNSPADEWSGDIGCGVQYLSQQCVARLIPLAGITVDESLGLPERLKEVQKLMEAGDERVIPIYQSVGVYLGYAIAHYADYYDFRHALILGRVTSGEGGNIILQVANEVLAKEFPELAAKVSMNLPDESNRRVGQAIAAASLPELVKEAAKCS